ncbi:hypothetical protein ACLKMH_09425 [Psychromonas sp. KJ10-10]|uniref:hypothetical protein n=1 Tax=Psychromonas sp. KJ10-10 TaxID=3391823 RepID=UPI0039B53599
MSRLEDFLTKNDGHFTFVSNIRKLSDNEDVFFKRIKILHTIKSKFGSRLNIIFWEAYAQEVISSREKGYIKFLPDNPLFRYQTLALAFGNNAVYPSPNSLSGQSLVELNIGLQPTIKGVLWLLMSNDNSLIEFEEYYSKFKASFFTTFYLKS